MLMINPMPEQVAAGDLQLLVGGRDSHRRTLALLRFHAPFHPAASRSAVWSALPSPSPYRARIPPCFTTCSNASPRRYSGGGSMGDDRQVLGRRCDHRCEGLGAVAGIVDGPCTDLTEIRGS